jgi:hypothetical protein
VLLGFGMSQAEIEKLKREYPEDEENEDQ